MEIPKFNELFVPVLRLLESNEIMQIRDFLKPLKEEYNLTDEEVNQMFPSGRGNTVFYDRVTWALSDLYRAQLLDKPKRGQYKINDLGRELLQSPENIHEYVKNKARPKGARKIKVSKSEPIMVTDDDESAITPKETLFSAFDKIKQSIYDDILTTILSKSPDAFEELVVQLLQKMGYGGSIKNSGTVTQRSHDNGIDGIIKEDVLGLDRIHIQAKRYSPGKNVGAEDIQKFVGALQAFQPTKGVFITTSDFTKNAFEYANNIIGATTIVLINGYQLAEYIYNYGLGMQVEQQIEIKKLDTDFWDGMEDNE